MEQRKVDMFVLSKGTLFPPPLVTFLREQMLRMDDDKWQEISSLQFRNPMIAMLLSVGCGTCGADRFYLGDWILGCLKMLCTIILFAVIVAIEFSDTLNMTLMVFFFLFFIIVLLWYFMDIFWLYVVLCG